MSDDKEKDPKVPNEHKPEAPPERIEPLDGETAPGETPGPPAPPPPENPGGN